MTLAPALVLRLRMHRTARKERRLMRGERWQEQTYVCTTEVGTALYPSNLRAHFARLCAQADVPRIRV